MTPADRQRRDALEHANHVRFRRAELRRTVKAAGEREGADLVADALQAPPSWLAAADLDRVLSWPRRVLGIRSIPAPVRGRLRRVTTRRMTVGELTPREASVLAGWLRTKHLTTNKRK